MNYFNRKAKKALTSYIRLNEACNEVTGPFEMIWTIDRDTNILKLTSIKCDKYGVHPCYNYNNNCCKVFHT